MHLWQKEKFNIDVKQYMNSEDAINKWIATVHAIGITKENNNIKIYAPYGLSDIYSRTIRPIKHEYSAKDIYNKKAKKSIVIKKNRLYRPYTLNFNISKASF